MSKLAFASGTKKYGESAYCAPLVCLKVVLNHEMPSISHSQSPFATSELQSTFPRPLSVPPSPSADEGVARASRRGTLERLYVVMAIRGYGFYFILTPLGFWIRYFMK